MATNFDSQIASTGSNESESNRVARADLARSSKSGAVPDFKTILGNFVDAKFPHVTSNTREKLEDYLRTQPAIEVAITKYRENLKDELAARNQTSRIYGKTLG